MKRHKGIHLNLTEKLRRQHLPSLLAGFPCATPQAGPAAGLPHGHESPEGQQRGPLVRVPRLRRPRSQEPGRDRVCINARLPVKVTHEPRNCGVRPPRQAGKLSIRVPARPGHRRPGPSALTGSAGAESARPPPAPRPPCLPVADGRFRARAPRRTGPRCAALASDRRAAPRSRVPAAASSPASDVAPPRARRLAPRADRGPTSRGRRSLAAPEQLGLRPARAETRSEAGGAEGAKSPRT